MTDRDMAKRGSKVARESGVDALPQRGAEVSSGVGCGDAAAQLPAQITLLYESRDGKMCLFEDAEGHLAAVRSALLA